LQSLFDRAIRITRKVDIEAKEETLREHILRYFHRRRKRKADEIVIGLSDALGIIPMNVIRELNKMNDEGIINWEDEILTAVNEIEIVR